MGTGIARLRALAASALVLGGCLIVIGSVDSGPAQAAPVSIPVIFRDFDHDPKVNAPNAHPDFETMNGDDTGIVNEALGSDNKPVYGNHPTGTGTTTGAAAFTQWFHDDATVNRTVAGTLDIDNTGGHVTYTNTDFFPMDAKGWNDPSFGNAGQVDDTHNFAFTMEMHMTFTYGSGQTFDFSGDDDVWVFFNKHLEIDLGGVHPEESDSVDLDTIAACDGMTAGNCYPLDIFFAERHTSGSDFSIDANFAITAAPTTTTTSTSSTSSSSTSSTSSTTSTTVATTTTTARPATTTTTAAVGATTIRRTGSNSGTMTVAGVGLFGLGALLGLAGRRRPSDGRHFA
jgi:fibro-slime domain-containing protein